MSAPRHGTWGYTNIVSVGKGQQSVSGLERVRRVRRISVLLDLSCVHPAGGFGETGDMHGSLVDAFVEQVFAGGLGLFIHDKTSPNTGHTRDPLQKHATIRLCNDAPEVFIRRKQITRFIEHGEPHAIRVRA